MSPENTENPTQFPAETYRPATNPSQDREERAPRVVRMTRKVQSKMSEFNETTIPDTFRKMPKPISPRVHAWLDFAVTTYFLGIGIWCAFRRRKGPATAALVNAGMVAGVSLLTDYDGDGRRPINFKMHGTLDAVQATCAAIGPVLHGFADKPEAKYFWGQAANELAVIASTDWDAGMRDEASNLAA